MIRRFAPAFVFLALSMAASAVHGQHYAAVNGFNFENFKTTADFSWSTDFTWELYRDTFLGIPPERDPWSSGFDVVFFDALYEKELGSRGNCVGMSMMSILIAQKGGHLGFCAPVNQYSGDLVGETFDRDGDGSLDTLSDGTTLRRYYKGPTNPRLRRAINQMHGHQANLPTLQHFLDVINAGKSGDGNFAYAQVDYYKMADDPTLVGISKAWNPDDGAHTMVAYDAKIHAGKKSIFVYDPNRPYSADPSYYDNNNNVITIGASGEWAFSKGGSTVWSGSPGGGGRIYITPISVTGPRARTPVSMGLDALSVISMIFVSGDDTSLKQVTNAEGKRLFRPGTLEIDIDPASGMRNVVPWFPSDLAIGDDDEERVGGQPYFIFGEPGAALQVEVDSRGKGYEFSMAGPLGHLRVLARGGQGVDRLTVQDIGTEAPAIQLRNTAAVEDYNVRFTQIVAPGRRSRAFALSNLAVGRDAPVELKIAADQSTLSVTPSAGPVTYDLSLLRRSITGDSTLTRKKLRVEAGEATTITPADWTNLKQSPLRIHARTRGNRPVR